MKKEKNIKIFKYPYKEVENNREREFLTEIADIITIEREFASKNKILKKKKPYLDIRGNNGHVKSIHIFSYINEFSEKIVPYLLEIPLYFPDLNDLLISNNNLESLPTKYLHDLEQLIGFSLINIKISELPNLESCKNLRIIGIHNAINIQNISQLSNLPNLEELYIKNAPKLHTLSHPSLSNLPNLKILYIEDTPELQNLPTFDNLVNLEKLRIENAPKLQKLPSFGSLINLDHIQLTNLGIKNLPEDIGRCSVFLSIFLTDCVHLQSLPDSICELKAGKIDIDNCPELKTLPECLLDYPKSELPIIAISGAPKIQASEEMRNIVKIYTPEEIEEMMGPGGDR